MPCGTWRIRCRRDDGRPEGSPWRRCCVFAERIIGRSTGKLRSQHHGYRCTNDQTRYYGVNGDRRKKHANSPRRITSMAVNVHVPHDLTAEQIRKREAAAQAWHVQLCLDRPWTHRLSSRADRSKPRQIRVVWSAMLLLTQVILSEKIRIGIVAPRASGKCEDRRSRVFFIGYEPPAVEFKK
jgi:hypothetical protein